MWRKREAIEILLRRVFEFPHPSRKSQSRIPFSLSFSMIVQATDSDYKSIDEEKIVSKGIYLERASRNKASDKSQSSFAFTASFPLLASTGFANGTK